MDVFITTGVFALVFIGALVLLTTRSGDAEQKQNLLRRMARPDDELDVDILRRQRPRDRSELLAVLARLNLLRRLEENMWQAGIYMRLSEMLLIVLLMMLAGLFLGQAIWHDMLFGLGCGVGLAALPLIYIRFRRARRMRAFGQQLPFALDLMKSSLEAGHSLNRGLQVVVQEFSDPLGSEFRTVLEQTRIGLPLPRALEDMLKRVPEDDLRLLVVAVKVQNEVGSSLAAIIGRLAEIVRTRQRLRLQVKALTAQSRMGGMIVGLLPIVVLAAFSLVNPDYARMLFEDPVGLKILKTAIVFDALAFITIRRLLKVKF
ncbi:type II secretion system F family protein [bacterium]|jgi:tight adherence protein B|nr:type II secretion system F family protein [bacterium]